MRYFGQDNEAYSGVSNQQEVKRNNLGRVFCMIKSGENVSRSSIAKASRLTPTTVSTLVDELCSRGLVMEVGMGESATGRKPVILKINPTGGMIPVLEMKPTGFQYTLYDLCYNELESVFLPFPAAAIQKKDTRHKTYRSTDKRILADTALQLLFQKAKEIQWSIVPFVCMVYTGSFLWQSNTFTSSVLGLRTSASFVEDIYRGLNGIPLFIENESICIAYAEKSKLVDRNDDLVFINVSNGVGYGRITRGKMKYSEEEQSIDFGHITIDMNGRKCFCGNRGCIERYISRPAIIEEVVRGVKKGCDSVVPDLVGGNLELVTLDVIRKALEQNDKPVLDILQIAARRFAYAISNMECIQATHNIIIGGGIEKLGDSFLNILREQIQNFGHRRKMENLNISYSNCGEKSRSLGIAQMCVDLFLP